MGSIDRRLESERVDEYKLPEVPLGTLRRLRVVAIGFGKSGIDLAYKLRDLPELEFQMNHLGATA